MKTFIHIVVTIGLSISIAQAQFNPAFEEFLEESMIFLDNVVDPIGLSISVRSGDKVWSDAIGISSIDDSLTTSSILAMGSITKTFISAGILKMMEDNRLTLSDPLHLYLPSFNHIDSTVTIKELLNHTSGIHDYTFHPEYFDIIGMVENQFYNYTPEEVIEQFVLERVFERGTRQEYSNTNYILLGMIISEIANRPFHEEIFETFDIDQNYQSISYPPFISDISALANLWSEVGSGPANIVELGIGLDGLFSTAGASGAFVGTPEDLAKWGYDLYSGKLLSESTMDTLFDFALDFSGEESGFGLGIINYGFECELTAVGHGGAIFYGSDLAYSEELDLSVAIMTNDNTDNSFSDIGGFMRVKEEILCAYKELIVTSSADIIDRFSVDIYPNPVKDFLNIDLPQKFDQDTQIEIYNEVGSLIYSQTMLNGNQYTLAIDIFAELSVGFYFVKIFDEDDLYTERIIKM